MSNQSPASGDAVAPSPPGPRFQRIRHSEQFYREEPARQCKHPDQIDFFAIGACPERSRGIIPAQVFYIIPLAATNNQPDILLTPHRKNSKYAQYKEAWHLLMREF
jgi:hypothetical protein